MAAGIDAGHEHQSYFTTKVTEWLINTIGVLVF